MRKAVVFLLVGVSFTWARADKALPGQIAPPLRLEKVLQAPVGAAASWEALRGKVVVLEFWATWCGPCIEAIPHLNELADQFKGQPVQFIAITDERESVAQAFLKRKAMRAWVGLDTDRSMFKDYEVGGIPHTVVVGTNGMIAAVTHPTSISAWVIRDVLAGKAVALPAPGREEKRVAAEASETREEPPVFQVLIRPSTGEDGSSSSGPSGTGPAGRMYRAENRGASMQSLVHWAYQTSGTRLVTNAALPGGRFDVQINLPSTASKRIPQMLRDALEATFGVRGRRETRDMEVYELKVKDLKMEETVSSGGSSSSSGLGRMSAVNSSISGLAWSLENLLGKPVLDKTGLTNRYDFQLKWKQQGRAVEPEVLLEAVHTQLGVELIPARQRVEVVILEVDDPTPDGK